MKKRYIAFLLVIGTTFVFSSCACQTGNGKIVSEIREIGGITGIETRGIAEVRITQGGKYYCRISSDENIISSIKTVIKDGVLIIKESRCIRSVTELTVEITLPELRSVKVDGANYLFSQNIVEVDNLELSMNGVGKMILDLRADSVRVDLNGVGEVDLKGMANSLDVNVNGMGALEALDLLAADTDVDINGAGTCRVNTTNRLDVAIKGMGTVEYVGSPEVTPSVMGLGNVVSLDR